MVWPPCASVSARALPPSSSGLREKSMSNEEHGESAHTQEVLGIVAHEIKNLLGPLALTLQLCERRALSGEPAGKEDLAFARAQVRRLSTLVNDLLDTTRL